MGRTFKDKPNNMNTHLVGLEILTERGNLLKETILSRN